MVDTEVPTIIFMQSIGLEVVIIAEKYIVQSKEKKFAVVKQENSIEEMYNYHKKGWILHELQEESTGLTYIRNSEYQELHQAINKLPKTQKRRIILRYFHGMTLQQIADLEKVNINAIRKSIDRALYKLKKLSNDFLI